jgi:antitoxin FitA
MCCTCKYVCNMPKMIQVRNVPDSLHRKLKARAALEGISLSDLVLKEMEYVAERPTLKELVERIASRTPVKYKVSPAEILRQERDSR